MKRLALVLLPVLLVLLTLALPGAAQEASPQPKIHIYVGAPGRQEVPLALPAPKSTDSAAAKAFLDVVRNDLELSGWFTIIDANAYVESKDAGLELGGFSFDDWEITGASALAKTGLSTVDGKLRAEVWVYDVPGRSKLGAKAFTVEANAQRNLAHRVADEIIFQVTGQRSPFNTRFAVVGSFTGNKEIYIVDWDGYGRFAVTKNGSINILPAWSPAGNAVAFTSFLAGNPDLYVADLAKGAIQRVSSRAGGNNGASWSPTSGLIALSMAPSGDPDVYVIDPKNPKALTRITKSPGIDSSPNYSPDGTQMAFVSDRSGGAQIYVMNIDGSGARRVTFQGSQNTDPAWSPDGQHIAFVSRDGVFDVFTVKLDGTGLTRITQGAGDNEDPSWSPDGNYIAFSSTRTGSGQIWMSSADGAHQVQLTQGKGGYSNPAWSPTLTW